MHSLGEFAGNLAVERHGITDLERQIDAALLQRRDHAFGRDISNECILGERAAAESANRGVKSSATGVVSGENLPDPVARCPVQVNADLPPTPRFHPGLATFLTP